MNNIQNERIILKNKIIYQDNLITKFLIESPKYGNFEILIDTEDLDKIKNYRWCIHFYEKMYYVYSPNKFKLHRVILGINNSKQIIDHINHNTLDNRKQNLRLVTIKENSYNRSKQYNNKLKFKGINKVNNKWRARLSLNNKMIHLGYFANQEQAALAYNIAASKYYGKFASLNNV